MDFEKIVKKRRAVKVFQKGKKIEKEIYKKVYELVKLSPSGYNLQAWNFLIFDKEKDLKELKKIAFNQVQFNTCSASIVVIGETNTAKNYEKVVKDFVENGYILEEKAGDLKNALTKNRKIEKLREMCIRNCSLASMNLIFAFENFGISTCPMMGFNQEKMVEFLKLGETEIPVLIISLGFVEKKVLKKQIKRKKFEEIFKFF